MKLNIAYPPYRSQQIIEVDDDKKLRIFYDKRISEEVVADALGDDFKGYVFKITGGYDKEGFAMKQGVLLNHRTRLLLDAKSGHFHPRRAGGRRRRSIRGCIAGPDLSMIQLIIVKRGPTDIPKLTDKVSEQPSTRGPKRANHIRAVWGLTKKDDVRKFVVRRRIPGKEGKPDKFKSPKIQRLITPVTRQRKRALLKEKRARYEKNVREAQDYQKLLAQRRSAARAALLSKKRETKSEKKSEKATKPTKGGAQAATPVEKATPKPETKKAVKATPQAKPATSVPAKGAAPSKPAGEAKGVAKKPAVAPTKPAPTKQTPTKPAPTQATGGKSLGKGTKIPTKKGGK